MNSAIKIGEDLPSLGNVGFGYNVNDNPPLAPTIDPSTSISNLETNGRQIRFRVTNEFIRGYFDFSLTLSDDGSRLTGNWIFTQYDTSRGLGFFAQRGRVPVVYLRAN